MLDPSKYQNRKIRLKDEGASEGEVTEIDFAGSGVSVAVSGETATVTIPGGVGSVAWGDVTGTVADQTDLQSALDAKQASDSDLTAIAALSPSNDDVVQRKAGAWTNRTPAQLKTDLALAKADVGLANVDNTSDASKPVSTATQTALDLKANDADVVHDTGNETIGGVKTFSSDPIIPDEAYGAGWNGVLEPPTKNAVYDKLEALSGYAIYGEGASPTTNVDATTYYYGAVSFVGTTAEGAHRLYIPKAGTIKSAYITYTNATATVGTHVLNERFHAN